MFKTARFKIHNPSRHKRVVLLYALAQYHLTLKRVLEDVATDKDLNDRLTVLSKSGKPRIDKAGLSRFLYARAPKHWPLAPLRDYLIGDLSAMLLSHYEKQLKGKNESNPPTLHGIEPLTEESQFEALASFANTAEFPLKPDQSTEIQEARAKGQVRYAKRLETIYGSRAASLAMRDLLRSLETPLPRPIEFTRCEFSRGFLLARKGNNFYLLLRLFSKGHTYWRQVTLDEGFINWRTKESIAGRKFPGVVLPLEFGRVFHEREYLENGITSECEIARIAPRWRRAGNLRPHSIRI